MMDAATRFWCRVAIKGDDDCWEFNGAKNIQNGYGRFRIHGKAKKAHRVAYELSNGPIPEGYSICHKCDNPACVNPNHLFAGTHQENMTDSKNKKRRANNSGVKNGRSKLTPDKVKEIRYLYQTGMRQADIARQFQVSYSAIRFIVTGKNWKEAANVS